MINLLGTKVYIQMQPTFPGSKAPVLKKVPHTADNPTLPQRKARHWLAAKAHGLQGTFGTVSDTGRGKGGPAIAKEIADAAPGKGTHGGLRSLRDYAIRRRKSDARIEELRVAAQG